MFLHRELFKEPICAWTEENVSPQGLWGMRLPWNLISPGSARCGRGGGPGAGEQVQGTGTWEEADLSLLMAWSGAAACESMVCTCLGQLLQLSARLQVGSGYSDEAALILHRKGFDCRFPSRGTGLLCSTTQGKVSCR